MSVSVTAGNPTPQIQTMSTALDTMKRSMVVRDKAWHQKHGYFTMQDSDSDSEDESDDESDGGSGGESDDQDMESEDEE